MTQATQKRASQYWKSHGLELEPIGVQAFGITVFPRQEEKKSASATRFGAPNSAGEIEAPESANARRTVLETTLAGGDRRVSRQEALELHFSGLIAELAQMRSEAKIARIAAETEATGIPPKIQALLAWMERIDRTVGK